MQTFSRLVQRFTVQGSAGQWHRSSMVDEDTLSIHIPMQLLTQASPVIGQLDAAACPSRLLERTKFSRIFAIYAFYALFHEFIELE